MFYRRYVLTQRLYMSLWPCLIGRGVNTIIVVNVKTNGVWGHSANEIDLRYQYLNGYGFNSTDAHCLKVFVMSVYLQRVICVWLTISR